MKKFRGNIFQQHDREMRRMQRIFWIFFSIVSAIILAIWVIYGYIAFYVLNNPESVGNWFGKLINGLSG
ncbi:hypothetical protein SMD22_00275 (plasmid) [Brevibacillus halotolerans]|nr:hypothetical protein SMD22_00275 [Brevibacillus halotolerans]